MVDTVRKINSLGNYQYAKHCKEVLTDRTRSIHEPIKKNSLPLFSRPHPKAKSKAAGKTSLLKHDVALLSHLYVVLQHRTSYMSTFFRHENHPFPPSLSDDGKLHLGKKSDLLSILAEEGTNPPNCVDVKVLDGAAVVHLLSTTDVEAFDEYADRVFIPHIIKQLQNSRRVDVIWDTYIPSSIKESAREKQGEGVRRKVAGKNKIPTNWADFLRDHANTQELFPTSLSMQIAPMTMKFLSHLVSHRAVRYMTQCDHEEADTRMLIHLLDALWNGCTNCLVRTVDTDVLVILLGKFHHLVALCQDVNVWVAFGSGKNYTHYHINAIYEDLGREKCLSLSVFHCFTSCDTTSAFFGRAKKSAWEAWNCFPDVTSAFVFMALHPHMKMGIDTEHFQALEHITVILYDKTSSLHHIDEARKEQFFQKGKTMERLPPTQDARVQHTKHVAYQPGIWCTSEHSEQRAPTPEGWGWTLNEENQSWFPIWNTLTLPFKACSELVKCTCKSQRGCGAIVCPS